MSYSQNNYDLSGRQFTKIIEFNIGKGGLPNLGRKTDIEKLLFPDKNSKIEFFIRPSFSGAYGFCIDKNNTTNSYNLAIKQVVNWEEVHDVLKEEFPSISMNHKTMLSSSKEEKIEIAKHNGKMFEMSQEEALSRYFVSTDTLLISQELASSLHDTYTVLIDEFVGKGKPAPIKDGYTAIFRCVVQDEVWSFAIQKPQAKFGELTKLCNQIVEDTKANNFNESKYLSLLNDILN